MRHAEDLLRVRARRVGQNFVAEPYQRRMPRMQHKTGQQLEVREMRKQEKPLGLLGMEATAAKGRWHIEDKWKPAVQLMPQARKL